MDKHKNKHNAKEKYGYQDCYKTKGMPLYCFCCDCDFVRVQKQASGYRCGVTHKYFCTHDGGVSDADEHCEMVVKLGTCRAGVRNRSYLKILRQKDEVSHAD